MKTQTELGIYSHRKIAFSLEVYLKRETTNNRKWAGKNKDFRANFSIPYLAQVCEEERKIQV